MHVLMALKAALTTIATQKCIVHFLGNVQISLNVSTKNVNQDVLRTMIVHMGNIVTLENVNQSVKTARIASMMMTVLIIACVSTMNVLDAVILFLLLLTLTTII